MQTECPILNNGIVALIALDQHEAIAHWMNSANGWRFMKMLNVYGTLGALLYSDYKTMQSQYFFNLVNHFDPNTIGQLMGVFTSAAVKALAFLFIYQQN